LAERQYSHYPADFCGCSNHNDNDQTFVPERSLSLPNPSKIVAQRAIGRNLLPLVTFANQQIRGAGYDWCSNHMLLGRCGRCASVVAV
jgi:hypothetical protein